MTLQTEGNGNGSDWITVQARVIRWDANGMGMEFVMLPHAHQKEKDDIRNIADRRLVDRFIAEILEDTKGEDKCRTK